MDKIRYVINIFLDIRIDHKQTPYHSKIGLSRIFVEPKLKLILKGGFGE